MNKFNSAQRNVQRERRTKKAQQKRLRHGMASLKVSRQSVSRTPSGKRQRKIEKKMRRAQKEVLESGLVSMQDIEMICADASTSAPEASSKGLSIKVRKLRLKKKNKQAKTSTDSLSTPQPMIQ